MQLKTGDRLLMVGDSITDCGRSWPVGEGTGGLGDGYVRLVDSLLTAAYPETRVQVLNMGISGNTSRDLQTRWQTDVLALQPDWLALMIGVNDVWRQFDSPLNPECHVHLDEYAAILRGLVAETLPKLSGGLVLMTPFLVAPNRQDPMRVMLDGYVDAVRRLAAAHQLVLVDTQVCFDRLLAHRDAAGLAWDRIHPTPAGHMVLARAFLQALGYAW